MAWYNRAMRKSQKGIRKNTNKYGILTKEKGIV